jgi:murein DD-endopeptidase MepM/ murein hydrolase activator NlpD
MNIKLLHPVEPVIITQGFGENPEIYKQFGRAGHNGIDYGVATGTPVIAAAGGCVDKTSSDPDGYGTYLRIDHGGYYTLYAHLQKIEATRGRSVKQGDLIAYSNNTGFSTGSHLHFELRIPEKKSTDYPAGEVDPTPYFVTKDVPKGCYANRPQTVDDGDSSVTESVLSENHEGSKTDGIPVTKNETCQVIAPAGLNAHIQPMLESEVIGAFRYGQALQVIEQQGDFVGVLVWVHRDWIKL